MDQVIHAMSSPPEPKFPETREHRCPACQRGRTTALGPLFANRDTIKMLYLCEACGSKFWFVRAVLLRETRDRMCPYCAGRSIVGLSHVTASATGIRRHYGCPHCGQEFVLCVPFAHGLITAEMKPRQPGSA